MGGSLNASLLRALLCRAKNVGKKWENPVSLIEAPRKFYLNKRMRIVSASAPNNV